MSNTTQCIGDVSFTEQPLRRRFHRGEGFYVVRTWSGLRSRADEFLVLLEILAPDFLSYEITEEGVKATIEVTYGVEGGTGDQAIKPADPISTVWTMDPNHNEISLWALPKLQNGYIDSTGFTQVGLAFLSNADLAMIRKDLNAYLSDDPPSPAFPYDDESPAGILYNRLLRGIEAFELDNYVLRKTETVSNKSALKAAHANAGKVFRYAQLVAAEPSLPAAELLDAAGLNTVPPDAETYWVKKKPKVDQVARGQFQIIQEYWSFYNFDPLIYQFAT